MATRKLMVSLAVVLLMKVSSTAAVTCGVVTCTADQGDCINDGTNDVCYCRPLFMGEDCNTGCAACSTSGEVCTGASACAACDPVCYSEGGSCATVNAAASCKCDADFSGNDCKTITCSSATAPCQNGGTCDTGVCTCLATHAGLVCELACADCDANKEKCATVDGTTTTCECIDGLSGGNCETITCGDGNPCKNTGTCNVDACTCGKDHAGFICEKECDPACTDSTHKCVESSGNPVCKATCAADTDCKNGGTCTAADLCDCATGWEGDLCEKAAPVCEPACTATQKCVEEDGSNVCKTTCADNDACKNNGTCANELCTCAEGWTGDLCTDSGVSSVVPSVLSMALFMLVIRL